MKHIVKWNNLVPFVLVVIGTLMTVAALTSPLFEWDVNVRSSELAPMYKVETSKHWVTRMGESLREDSEALLRLRVYRGHTMCEHGVRVMIQYRGRMWVEQFSNLFGAPVERWIAWSGLLGVIVSGVYPVVKGTLIDGQTLSEVRAGCIGVIGIGAFLFVGLTLLGHSVSPYPVRWPPWAEDCAVDLQLRVTLVKIHWVTLSLLLIGETLKLVAMGVLVRGLVFGLRGKRAVNAG